MDINAAYRYFINDRKVYCSKATIDYYNYYLNRFLKWYSDSGSPALDRYMLKNYILFLRESDMKNVSIKTCYRAVKAFFRFLYEEEILDHDITKGVKLPKNDAALIQPLLTFEVDTIDKCIMSLSDELALRNYCIFHLMLDCGLRRQEVIHLQRSDIKFDRLIIRQSKGNKDRITLLPKFLYLSLNNYYNHVHYHFPGSYSGSEVFLNANKNDVLTYDCIKMMFQKLKSATGITRLHAHLCRHTFATSYLQYGGDMEKLRLLMGHSDYNVLRNYLHLSIVYSDIYRIDDIFFRTPDT